MVKVNWTPENDRKLLLNLMAPYSKDIDLVALSALFPGSTPKAIEEHIAKLRREKKASQSQPMTTTTKSHSPSFATSDPDALIPSIEASPPPPAPKVPKKQRAKSAVTGEVLKMEAAPVAKKRGREPKAKVVKEEGGRKKKIKTEVGEGEKGKKKLKTEGEDGEEGEGGEDFE